jgi:hypothetical protein
MERIVLMFAYHFPPENAIGGARPYQFYKYLSRKGYRCHVITAAQQTSPSAPDFEYVGDPFPEVRGIGWQLERAARKFLMPGATGLRWSRLAYKSALAFLRSHQGSEVTIFSTSPPLGTHLAAFRLARNRQFKWIADFRDPLANNPGHIGLTKFQETIHRRLEQSILESSTITIANTDALADKLKKNYPNRSDHVHLIWNGFDPEDRIQPLPAPERDHLVISHVGELYGGRDVSPLLESVSRLIETGRLAPNDFKIRLVGSIEHECIPPAEFLTMAIQQGWLEVFPNTVPKDEARRVAQDSNALLLVQPHSTVQVPGKLFEYLRLGRPILAFIPPNTPTERILRQSGVPYRCAYAGSSIQEMDNAVHDFFQPAEAVDRANLWFEENFNAEKQTQALDALIRSLHR